MISKHEYIREVKLVLAAFASNLVRVVPGDLNRYFKDVDLELAFGDKPESIAELAKLDDFYCATFLHWFDHCFEYGVNGIMQGDQNGYEEIETEDYFPFWEGLKALSTFLENNGPVNSYRFDLIDKVLEKARCRSLMDFGSFLFYEKDGEPGASWTSIFLTELATLADLDEKTIRNMASAKKGDFPTIIKVDGRSLVDKEEARAWLKKRGWKETVYTSVDRERQTLASGFQTRRQFEEFIENSLGKTHMPQDLAAAIRALPDAMAAGERLDLRLLAQWGLAADLPEKDLYSALFGLKQKLEAEAFKKMMRDMET